VPDPYVLPNGTLRNRLGVGDASELSRREDQLAAARQAILVRKGLEPPFDFEKLREIHRYILQDVYDWAGKPRTCDLRKAAHLDSDESPKQFTPSSKIKAEADRIFGSLIRKNELRGLSPSNFTQAAAELFVEVNNIHPFREGNGRAQRIFLSALAKHAGHELAFDAVTRERMIEVSVAGIDGDVAGARRLFQEISDARRVEALRKALKFLKESNAVPWNDLYIATTTAGQAYAGVLVGMAGDDYMMRVSGNPQDWIAVGDVHDLPENSPRGDSLTVTAKRF
jgi:cell filamentation protein